MKHLVIGAGVTGDASGFMLESLGENVFYHDVDKTKLIGRKTMNQEINYDIYWVCVAEWNTEEVLKKLAGTDKIVVIRSTVPPGFTDKMQAKYSIPNIAHCPEFLREISARQDAVKPDRVIIATRRISVYWVLFNIFARLTAKVYWALPTESELIKLISNAYLSTQISFWNEIGMICKQYEVDTKRVIEGCKGDHRIGYYGSDPTRGAYSGTCLPKDMKSIIRISKNHILLKAVEKVNENVKRK